MSLELFLDFRRYLVHMFMTLHVLLMVILCAAAKQKKVDGPDSANSWELRDPQAIGKGSAHDAKSRSIARGGGVRR